MSETKETITGLELREFLLVSAMGVIIGGLLGGIAKFIIQTQFGGPIVLFQFDVTTAVGFTTYLLVLMWAVD